MKSITHLSHFKPKLIGLHEAVSAARLPPPPHGRVAVLRALVEPQPQRSPDHQGLHDEGGAEPGHGVLQRDQPHEVVAELRVVPGAGVELPQQVARPELPEVSPEGVDQAAQQDGAAAPQFQVHALDDEDAGAVDEEGPHAGHAGEFPVAVHGELPGRREHDLAEVAVDGVEVPARRGREGDGRGRGGGVQKNHPGSEEGRGVTKERRGGGLFQCRVDPAVSCE